MPPGKLDDVTSGYGFGHDGMAVTISCYIFGVLIVKKA